MKICNFDYLKSHSPNNPKFLAEMIEMLLTQTPAYFKEIEKSLSASDWNGVHGHIHKIRPFIDLIGLPKTIGVTAKQIEEFSGEQSHLELVPDMFLEVQHAFEMAYVELEEELKKSKSDS